MTYNVRELRYIEGARDLASAEGLAADEALALLMARSACAPTLHMYRYLPSVIVGRYQNLTDAVNLDACRENGYVWNRRHTGGGTVVMGPGQVAIALALPEPQHSSIATIREHFMFFSGVLAAALARFGLKAELMGKNDLTVGGRKIAGLAISQDIDGCAFLHCSLLLDLDVGLMVRLLNLATRDLDDRGQSCFAQRMTTVCEHSPNVTHELIRIAILEELEAALGVKARREWWTESESALIAELCTSRYENDSWIYSTRVMRRWTGAADRKTSGGNLRVYVDVSGGVLDAVLITGDYFSRDAELAQLEASLRYTPAENNAVCRVLKEKGAELLYRVSLHELAEMICEAAVNRISGRILSRS